MKITDLSPSAIWKNFHSLTQIPRPSGHEEEIQQFLMKFGQDLGLETEMDEAFNILIRKPATSGMENRKGVILQNHLDMVPQKNGDKVHDFTKDPIETIVEGEWLTANGTTLGADNGVGAAIAMAILEATDIEHGPVEALFTATEESGMDGAKGVRAEWIKGDILLNIDSEDEGELYVGCAGGIDLNSTFFFEPVVTPKEGVSLQLNISGLKGGHSGLDINRGRANANKLVFRFLQELSNECDFYLGAVDGGSLRNAIPRECSATVVIDEEDQDLVKAFVTKFSEIYCNEYGTVEPNLLFTVTETAAPESVMPTREMMNLISSINICPNGVIEMSRDVEGLVETSTNLASIKQGEIDGTIEVSCLIRSSVDSSKEYLSARMISLFEISEAYVETGGSYPGWKPNLSSNIMDVMKDTYNTKFGKTPAVKAIHAGLECAILGAKYPNWDMISFGPTIRYPHSPDEKIEIATVEKVWDFLVATLKEIPTK